MINAVSIKQLKLQLGTVCKQQRKKHSLSQEELADALALSRYTIQKFESGKNATVDTALKIANHFNLLEHFYQSIKKFESANEVKSLY